MTRSHAGRGVVAAIGASAALLLTVGTAQADDVQTITDHYLFEVSLDEFTGIRAERPYPDQLDWSSDSCSWSPDEPLGYDFSKSCDRHDFGYRNYQKQERFIEDNRLKIDDNFKADMYSRCADDGLCEAAANVYYWAVREFGSSTGSTADALHEARISKTTNASGEVEEFRAVDTTGETVEFQVG